MRGILLTFLLCITGWDPVMAQVIPVAYNNSGTQYVQSFDGLPSSGSFTLTGKGPYNLNSSPINAAGMSGWQVFMMAGTNPAAAFAVSTGSSTGNGVYSLGASAAADRALGSLSSSTGIYSFGVVLTNQTGGLLNSFTINFTAEQWRKGGSAVKNIWACRFKTGNISQIDQTELIDEPNLNFGSVITTSGGSALNGNLPENRQLISYTVNGIIWKPGEQLLVRWDDADEAGSDDAVGIDNFSFSATLLSSAPLINNISATAITANAAQLSATVNENFAAASVFFEYDTSGSFNTKMIVPGNPDSIKAGMGNTNVIANLSGLKPGTVYYYRMKATNINGSVLGSIQNFTSAINLPTIISGAVFSVTTNSALMGGNVTDLGGASVTEKGIVWSVNNIPTVTDNKIISGNGMGSFTQLISGLPEGNIVYTRAYAINSGGIAYGDVIRFVTQTTITQFNSLGSSRTKAASTIFTFKTAKNISGLSAANFAIQATGISGASITAISGSGNTYTITINTGTGDGKLGLLFLNDSGLSVPVSNKPITADNPFIIDKTPPQILGVSIPNKTMLINDTVIATISVKPDTDVFKMLAGTVGGMILSGFTKNNDSLYAATFTILNGGRDIDASADIPVTLSLIDSVGNISTIFKDSIRQSQDQMDANRPVIISIQNPQKGIYKIGDSLHFVFRFSEKILVTNINTTTLGITIGTRSRTAFYVSGSGTDSLLFRYMVSSGDLDKDGIKTASSITTGTGLIKDLAGNTATTSFSNTLATKEILVDGVAPVINSVTVPAAGIYRTGNLMDFMVNFSKKIYVNEEAIMPCILITIGSKQKTANYISGSGSTALLFRYTVQVDDVDTNGIKLVSSMVDSSLSVKDSIGNKSALAFSNIGSMLGVKINPPTTFIESVLVPPAGNYKAGDTIDILVNYNERVWVTTDKGTPSLKIIVGSSSKQAIYNDGSGGNTLFFSYVVQPGDEDTDGIQLNNFITLNSGSIKNENGYNVPLVLNNVGNTDKLLIDGIAPVIKSLSLPPGRTYITGDTLDFIFHFTEKIIAGAGITASTFSITIGTKNTIAKYTEGNKSDSLIYRYIIQPNDLDKDGIKINSPLSLPNTFIKDVSGNIGDPGFSILSAKNILVDAVAPVITNLITPLPGIYRTGNMLDIVFTYSKKIYLINNVLPFINIKIGSRFKNAFYSKGSGTNSLVFSYRVEADDMDSSGIQIVFPITDFSSLVKDTLGNTSASINLNSRELKGVYVNPPAITINRFTMPPGGLYKTGDTLQFQVLYSEPVIVSTKNGSPYIVLKTNTATRQAVYSNGSGTNTLYFKYIIQTGDTDNDGVEVDSILSLNNSTIQNSKLVDAFVSFMNPPIRTEILLDGVNPVIKELKAPSIGIYKAGDSLDFIVRFSEKIFFVNGTPSLPLTIGTKAKTALYVSGNGTDSLLFKYRIVNGDLDTDGIKTGNLSLNNSTVKDLAGNIASLVISNLFIPKNILIDAIAPVISNTSVPASGNYKTGDTLNFMVGFSEKVWVRDEGKRPTISFQIGSLIKEAVYIIGAGSNTLLFSYKVQTEDLDTNGIKLNTLITDVNSEIKDSAGNNAVLTLNNIGNTSGIKINPPLISFIQQVQFPAAGIYKTGDSLWFVIQFSDVVSVSSNNSFAYIKCTIGSTAKQARYISGSGTENLSFLYVIQSGDLDKDGIIISNIITTNGTEIKNGKGNTALLNFNVPSVKNIFIDGIKPVITSVSTPNPNVYKTGNILDFLISFSEKVFIIGGGNPPSLPLSIGNTIRNAVYINGSGSNTLLFRYTVQQEDMDNDGIKLSSPINNNDVSIIDSAGNTSALTLVNIINTSGIIINPAVVAINSIILPSEKTYRSNDTLELMLNYSEPVFVNTNNGIPSVKMVIGNITKQALYLSGSGTNYISFRYLIQNGDLDTDGIKLASNLSLNSGSVKDARGNIAPLILPKTAITTNIKVDAVSPVINNIISTTSGIYKSGDTLDLQLIFSEPVFLSNKEDTIKLPINIGNLMKNMICYKGSGTEKLSFRYIVQLGDLDKNGIAVGSALIASNNVIKDLAGNSAINTIKTNIVFTGILVDAVSPVFTSLKTDTVLLCENSNAIKINTFLNVIDTETAESLVWKIKNNPLLGNVSTLIQNANSNGKIVQCPLIEYNPYNNQNGIDSLAIEVSDGINISQKKILFIIQQTIKNNTIGSTKTICSDQTPGILTGSTPTGGDGQYTFLWELSSGTDSTNFSMAPGNNKNPAYTSPQLTNNTWFRRNIQSGACSDTSSAIRITVLKNGVWTGNTSTDWNNSNNWCGNSIPNKSTDVLINNNTLFQPKIRDTVWCNQLTLSNTTHLTIEGVLKINQTINALDHSIDAAKGAIIFSGSNTQNLSGKLFEHETIQNLIIQNPFGVNISDSLSIKGTVLLQSGTLNTNNRLFLKHGASVGPSASGTLVNGSVITEHKIAGGRRVYQLLGNPFTEDLALNTLKDSIDITGDKGSANGFTNTITNQPSAFWFDPLNGNDSAGIEAGWQPFMKTNGSGENMWQTMHGIRLLTRGKPGQGLDGIPAGDGRNGTYLPEDVTIKLKGYIHSGDVELALQKNARPTYHVIANPYISNIDLSYLTKGKDIANNYWIWNPLQGLHGGYTSLPFKTKYILPPWGAFIAKTNGNQFNSFLFTENMKTSEAFVNSMDLTDMNEIFHVELRLQSDSIFWDRILLLQMDSAKIFYDRNDAEKLWNSDVNFYSLSRDSKMLSIDARPFNNESTIPLGLQTESPSAFTIRVTKTNLPPSNTLQLHDKFLNKWMPLFQDSSYTFTTTADTSSFGNERFEITSIKKQENNNVQKQQLITSVYPVPAKEKVLLQFNALEAGNTTVRILNVSGTVIHSISLGMQKQGQLYIPLGNLINGIYLVELKCGNEINTQKIIKE